MGGNEGIVLNQIGGVGPSNFVACISGTGFSQKQKNGGNGLSSPLPLAKKKEGEDSGYRVQLGTKKKTLGSRGEKKRIKKNWGFAGSS